MPPRKTAEKDAEAPSGRRESLPGLLGATGGAQARGPSVGPDSFSASDEILMEEYNALRELFLPGETVDALATRTHLNHEQVVQYARGLMYAKYYGVPMLEALVYQLMRNLISLDRKSRKEFVAAMQSMGTSGGDDASGAFAGIMSKLGR